MFFKVQYLSYQKLYPEETTRSGAYAALLGGAKRMQPSERTNKSFCSQNHFISILARNALNNASFFGYSKGHLLVYKQLQQLCSPETLLRAQNKAWELTTSSGDEGMGQVSGGLLAAPAENHCQISFLSFFTSTPNSLLLSPPLPK